ncbi:MAG: protein phosphatase 2C domain-containing protein, partial [Anaerolineae bacterium]
MSAETIRLDPRRETPATGRQGKRFGYRYAYARSADSRAADDPGQDFLIIREDGVRLCFALCDGVSQSFYGDLAARLLGEALVDWLWRQRPSTGADPLRKGLEAYLDSVVGVASEIVASHPVPDDLPPMVRQVLEEKRALGSESTFIAGLVDTEAGAAFLAWMGDSRLRLWDSQGEFTARLGDTFHTQERWSTRRGRIGQLHTALIPLHDLRFLVAYSDGLAILDRRMTRHLRDTSIEAAIAYAGRSPTSDDISYLEIWLGDGRPSKAHPLRSPASLRAKTGDLRRTLRWEPVDGALQYEVELDTGQTFLVKAPTTWLELPDVGNKARVRAWDEEPGEWSRPISLPMPKAPSPAPPVKIPLSSEERMEATPKEARSKVWWIAVAGGAITLSLCGLVILVGAIGPLSGFFRPTPTPTATHTPTVTPTLTTSTATPPLTATLTLTATSMVTPTLTTSTATPPLTATL